MVYMSIRGLGSCLELAQGLQSTCWILIGRCVIKNGLVSCPTCNSMLHKFSTKLAKLSARSIRSREACCGRTLTQLSLQDSHSCIRRFAAAKARPMLTKPQKLNSDYEMPDRPNKKKKKKEKKDGRERSNAPHLLRHLSQTFLCFESLDSSAKMKKGEITWSTMSAA